MRRLLGMIMLMLAAGTLTPAAAAVAAAHRPAGPGPQRFGVRLVDVPVSEETDPRAYRYIVDYLPTGTVIHRRILVMNQEAHTEHFTVYPDAAQIGHGQFTGAAGQTRNELTGWISVQHPKVTLGPEQSVTDMVTIKVPRGATRGEHYGVIWVQQAAYVHASKGLGINEVSRVGMRVYLAVGHGGVPPTTFAITSITGRRSASGQPSLVVRVHNTGGRAVDLNGTAGLTGGPGNSVAGPVRAQQILTLSPGQSGIMTFAPARSLPDGPWRVRVTLKSGLVTCVGTATVTFSRPVASQAGLPAMAWLGVILAAAVATLGLVAVFLMRSAQRRPRASA